MKNKLSELADMNLGGFRDVFIELWRVLTQDLTTISSENIKACSKIIMNLSSVDNGIQAMLDFKDKAVLLKIFELFFQVKKLMNMEALEDILEIIHVVMETLDEGIKVNSELIYSLMDIVVHQSKFHFSVQIEAAKLLNLLLEKYPDIHTSCSASRELFIKSFGLCLTNAGDYELQASIIEAIFRMVTIDERLNIVKLWFEEQQLQNALIAIRNEEFEMDCRRFLNYFNNFDASTQKVFSFPVQCVSLGRYQLNKPIDFQISEFWLDFNIGSKSISTYVQDGSTHKDSDWEMVVIKKEIIKDFRVNVSDEKIILIIKLTEPSYTLVPFCPESSEYYVKIIFANQDKVIIAVQQLLGEIKFVNVPVAASPSNSSIQWCRSSSAISPLNVQVRTVPKEKVVSNGTSSNSDIQKNESKNIKKCYISPQSITVKNSCERIEGEKNGVNEDTKEIKQYNMYESIINKDTGRIKESEVFKRVKKEKKIEVNEKEMKDNTTIINETQEIKKNKGKKKTFENKNVKEAILSSTKIKKNKEDKKAVESNKISQEVIESTNELNENTNDVADNIKNIVARVPPLKTNKVTQANNHSKSSIEKSLMKNLAVAVELNCVNNVDGENLKNVKVKQKNKKTSGNQSKLSSSLSNISNNKLDSSAYSPQMQPDISTSQLQDKNLSGVDKHYLEHDVDFKISESFEKAKFDDSKLKKCKKLLQTKQAFFQDSPDESYVAPPISMPHIRSAENKKKRGVTSEICKTSAEFDFSDKVCPLESEGKKKVFIKKENKKKEERVDMDAIEGDKRSVKGDKKKESKETLDKVAMTDGRSLNRPSRACKDKTKVYKEPPSDVETPDILNKQISNKSQLNKSVSFVSLVDERAYFEVKDKFKESVEDAEEILSKNNQKSKVEEKKSSENNQVQKKRKRTSSFCGAESSRQSLNSTKDFFKKMKKGFEKLHTNLFDFEESDTNECLSQEPWWKKKNQNTRVKKQYKLKRKQNVQTVSLSSSDSSPEIVPKNKKNTKDIKMINQVPKVCLQKQNNKKKHIMKGKDIEKNEIKKREKKVQKVKVDCPKVTNMLEISDFSESSSQDSSKSLQDMKHSFLSLSKNGEPKTHSIPQTIIYNKTTEKIISAPEKQLIFSPEKQLMFSPETQLMFSPAKLTEQSPLASTDNYIQFTDETPVGVSVEPKKKWLNDLNHVFNKIEAVANQFSIKKKLWKSPVVAVNDDFIEGNIEEQRMSCMQKNKTRFKRKTSPVKNLPVTCLTLDSKEEVEDENLETVNNFAVFCKSILERSSSKMPSKNCFDNTQTKFLVNKMKKEVSNVPAEECSPYCSPDINISQKKEQKFTQENKNTLSASSLEISSDDILSPPDCKRPFIYSKSVGYKDNKTASEKMAVMNENLSVDKFICKVAKVAERKLDSYLEECYENRQNSLNSFSELCSKELNDWYFASQTKSNQIKKTLKQLQLIMTEHLLDEKKHIKHLNQMHHNYVEEQQNIIKDDRLNKSNMLSQLHLEIRSIKLQMSNSARETQITSFRRSLEMMLNNV